jgi:homoserine dehydrogenase
VSLHSVQVKCKANETSESELAPHADSRECLRAATSPRPIRVGLLGYGRVGQAVAYLAERRRDRLLAAGVDVRCVKALVRDPRKPRLGPRVPLSTGGVNVLESDVDVVVEVLGGLEPARELVTLAIDAGIPVVTANKTLVASAGAELRSLARRRHAAFAFDAAVLAGVPFLGSLSRRPLVAGAREIAGVLNGTSNFILSEMANGASFDDALAEAIARGYAEPDCDADLSGLDAAQKLSILLQLAGCAGACASDLPRAGLTILEPRDLAAARRLGGAIKPVAFASLAAQQEGAWVGPAFVRDSHPLSRLIGVTNGVQLTDAEGRTVTFSGPGAGPDVTAATILDDIVEIFSGCAGSSGASPERGIAFASKVLTPPSGGWFVRIAGEQDLQPNHAAEFFAANGAPVLHLLSDRGHLAGLTAPADSLTVHDAVEALRSIGARAIALPILESGAHE